MGEKVLSFETNDTMLNYSSQFGFNDINYPFAYGEEKFSLFFIKNLLILKKITSQHKKGVSVFFLQKMVNYKVIVLQLKTKVLLNMVMSVCIVKKLVIKF